MRLNEGRMARMRGWSQSNRATTLVDISFQAKFAVDSGSHRDISASAKDHLTTTIVTCSLSQYFNTHACMLRVKKIDKVILNTSL